MKSLGLALTSLILSLSFSSANAAQFTVTNSTKGLVSVRINGSCSKEFGVLKVLTSATVDGSVLSRYCGAVSTHCLAEVFASTTCQDGLIGYFYLNTAVGNTGEGNAVAPYRMVIKPFRVTVSQP
jgi:hypothetical protein